MVARSRSPQDLAPIVEAYLQDVVALPGYQDAANIVRGDQRFTEAFTSLGQPMPGLIDIGVPFPAVRWLFAPYLLAHLEAGSDKLDPDVIEIVDRDLHAFLHDPSSVPLGWMVSFWNAQIPSGMPRELPIEVIKGVHFRQAGDEEQADWQALANVFGLSWEALGSLPLGPFMHHTLHSLGPVMEADETVGRLSSNFPQTFVDDWISPAQIALFGLRVLQPNWVGLRAIRVRSPNRFLGPRLPVRWQSVSMPTGEQRFPVCELSTGVLCELGRSWSQFGAAINDETLTVPRRRLFDAYERTNLSDRLVDFWIALESLIVPPTGKEDLVRIVEASIPLYIYLTQTERQAIRPYIRDSYDLRSKVVHGDARVIPWNGEQAYRSSSRSNNPPAKTKNELVALTGEWVRRALRKRAAELVD